MLGGGWEVEVNRFPLFDTQAKFLTCFPKNGMRNVMLLRDLGLRSLISCGLLNVLPIWRYMKSAAHLKVLIRVTRNATDRRALALYRMAETFSQMLLLRTCSESSLEDELQKFDCRPEHPKNNRSVNGILRTESPERGLHRRRKKKKK
ncbi:hypothetical protein CEXT_443091 [Caerostris extrusa]|uniref:Uncharacterized protein n=1 Tax=Caerostris extrusa TaxID=172846 RepID=A0AAV4NR84_CAEEX|nr:hypothetical protein CEXT_443091 [Caerostris extrusa]